MRKSLFLILISYSLSIFSFEFSVMTLNAQNLFDTIDDPKKNDKAYLPIELKQSKNILIHAILLGLNPER